MTVVIKGETYEVTEQERAEYDRLVATGVYPEVALAIVTGDQDVTPELEA